MGFDGQGLGNGSFCKNLDTISDIAHKTAADNCSSIDNSAAFEDFKLRNVYYCILFAGQRGKTALGKTTLHRHLPALKTRLDASAGPCLLPFVSFCSSFPMT